MSTNLITVGSGVDADFADLREAMNSIIDASENNPYTILLMPGIHTLKESDTKPLLL